MAVTETPWEDCLVGGVTYQRKVLSTPGFDCRAGCSAECPHADKTRDYGCHGDQHTLGMRLEHGAASLTLFSSYLGGETLLPILLRPVRGATLTRCWAFPVDAEQVRRGTPSRCDFQRSGVCYPEYYSALGAARLVEPFENRFPLRGDVGLEQIQQQLLEQSDLWVELGRFLLSAQQEMLDASAALPKRCPTCNGEGVVPQKESS